MSGSQNDHWTSCKGHKDIWWWQFYDLDDRTKLLVTSFWRFCPTIMYRSEPGNSRSEMVTALLVTSLCWRLKIDETMSKVLIEILIRQKFSQNSRQNFTLCDVDDWYFEVGDLALDISDMTCQRHPKVLTNTFGPLHLSSTNLIFINLSFLIIWIKIAVKDLLLNPHFDPLVISCEVPTLVNQMSLKNSR